MLPGKTWHRSLESALGSFNCGVHGYRACISLIQRRACADVSSRMIPFDLKKSAASSVAALNLRKENSAESGLRSQDRGTTSFHSSPSIPVGILSRAIEMPLRIATLSLVGPTIWRQARYGSAARARKTSTKSFSTCSCSIALSFGNRWSARSTTSALSNRRRRIGCQNESGRTERSVMPHSEAFSRLPVYLAWRPPSAMPRMAVVGRASADRVATRSTSKAHAGQEPKVATVGFRVRWMRLKSNRGWDDAVD